MPLKASISITKKFFKKTLQSFKSFLSGGYQRIPKSPPFNPFPCSPRIDRNLSQSHNELDKFYLDFTNEGDSDKDKVKKRSKKKIISSPVKNDKEVYMKITKSSIYKNYEVERREDQEKKRLVCEGKRKEELISCSRGLKEGRSCLVQQKLKELEMVDRSNIELGLDIEEVLHYYSRLTCPAYVDIVDKFFMDMDADLSSLQASDYGNSSRPNDWIGEVVWS